MEETDYPETPKDLVEALRDGWRVDDREVVHRGHKQGLPFDDYVIGMHKFFNYGNQKAIADVAVPGHLAEMMLSHFRHGEHSVRMPILMALGLRS